MLKASCLAACPIVALLYLGGAAAAQPDNVKTAIDRANAAFVAAFAKGDSAAIAAMYSASRGVAAGPRAMFTSRRPGG